MTREFELLIFEEPQSIFSLKKKKNEQEGKIPQRSSDWDSTLQLQGVAKYIKEEGYIFEAE